MLISSAVITVGVSLEELGIGRGALGSSSVCVSRLVR
jgi:hypothetical protein